VLEFARLKQSRIQARFTYIPMEDSASQRARSERAPPDDSRSVIIPVPVELLAPSHVKPAAIQVGWTRRHP
jgi:hypothetical protein